MNIIDVIKSGDYLLLDTETSGLLKNPLAEIVQIAVINAHGETLLNTLVKTVHPIPPEATRIHGITDDMVKDAPTFPATQLVEILSGKNVIIYNALYDTEMLFRTTAIHVLPHINWNESTTFYCAMNAFAEIYGDWNNYRHSYMWKSLAVATDFYKIKATEAHSALGDCLSTLALCQAMAADKESEK